MSQYLQSDVFVEKMFRIIDKDGNGKISFQEFLDTVTRFTSAGPEQVMTIIFHP